MPKKSIISNKYWKRLQEEKDRQLEDKGFYRKSNWSEDFKSGKSPAQNFSEEVEEEENERELLTKKG